MAREVFQVRGDLLYNGLALDGLDAHDAHAVVAGLCIDLVAEDPGAAVRARSRATLETPDDLHYLESVSRVYPIAASLSPALIMASFYARRDTGGFDQAAWAWQNEISTALSPRVLSRSDDGRAGARGEQLRCLRLVRQPGRSDPADAVRPVRVGRRKGRRSRPASRQAAWCGCTVRRAPARCAPRWPHPRHGRSRGRGGGSGRRTTGFGRCRRGRAGTGAARRRTTAVRSPSPRRVRASGVAYRRRSHTFAC